MNISGNTASGCMDTLRNLISVAGFLLLLAAASPAEAATYQIDSSAGVAATYPWIDISTTGTTLALTDDSMSNPLPIGFTFPFGGIGVTAITIGSNGWQFFSTGATLYTNTDFPVGQELLTLPYWDDLNPGGVATYIRYQTTGTAPNRIFVVSYLDVPHYCYFFIFPTSECNSSNQTTSIRETFQVQYHEATGDIIYWYKTMSTFGGGWTTGPVPAGGLPEPGATIGLEIGNADYSRWSYDTNSITNGKALRFYYSTPYTTPMPYAWYKMDEAIWGAVTDASGNGRNGIKLGSAAPTGYPPSNPPASAKPGDPGTCGSGGIPITDGTQGVDTGFDLNDVGNSGSITFWYNSNTAWNDGNNRMLLDASNNLGHNDNRDRQFYLVKTGNGSLLFSLEDSNNNESKATTGNNGFAANTWHHIAITWNLGQDRIRIYLDGILSDTSTTNLNGTLGDMLSLYIGDQRGGTISGASNYTANSANGYIDEVRIYNTELTIQDVVADEGRAHACSSGSIDHIRIEHDGDGLTCMPETVTIKACADPACATLYTGSTTVTLSGSGWTSNPITFTSGSGTTDLSITTPQTVTLGTSTVSPLPAHATDCYVGTTADCNLVFTDAGFIFSGSAGGAEATIPSQIAGTSSGTYYLRAVKKNYTTMACEAALAGATTVNFAYECNDPATCYAADLMNVNGGSATTIARNNNGNVSSYTPVNMTFDANGNAPFTFNYGDAGKVTLHAKKAVNSVTLTGASNAFVVKPYDFGVIPCASSVVGNCTTAPADPGLLGGGSVFAKAGAAFKATVTARTATGTATPSFGAGSNNTTEKVNLTHTRIAPTGSGTADGALGGTTSIPRSSFTDGIATVSDLNWSEVGVVTLTATNSTFLGNALTTTGTTGNLGRFIPDHFAIAAGSVAEGCDPGNFTYFGQDGFSTAFTLTTQNTANATTQNYTGNFAKFDLTAWNNYNFTAAWLPAAPNPASTLLASTTAPTGSWSNGTASVIAKHLASRPAAPVAPATITVNAKPADTDGVTMASAVAVQTAATPLRYGRIVLQNAYGPETAAIKMRLLTQYYNGTSFIANPDDTCSKYSATSLTCGNLIGPITCTDVTASGVGISNGQYFTLSAPMKTGTLLYTLTVDSWLQYEWIAPIDYKDNPTGRANFGIYRGNDRIINWREIIR
ncbi:MAG: DUF6701 domain-containing protein [Desulfurivibrionaceae bacterium]